MYFDPTPGPVFRPPSEANSLILRITIGCSHNKCSFCSMYKGIPFQKRTLSDIFTLIEKAAQADPHCRRIFLADGNALCLPTEYLIKILDKLYEVFPKLQRVTSYSAPQDLLQKSSEEFHTLKNHGLKMLYLGLESGNDQVLSLMSKGATSTQMIQAAQKVMASGIKLSVMIIIGLGGTEHSIKHILSTAQVVSQISPTYLSALSLMIHPNTELRKQVDENIFFPLSPYQMMEEVILLIENIDPITPIIFRSSHPSNFAILAGNLPKDQSSLIAEAKSALIFLKNKTDPTLNDRDRY